MLPQSANRDNVVEVVWMMMWSVSPWNFSFSSFISLSIIFGLMYETRVYRACVKYHHFHNLSWLCSLKNWWVSKVGLRWCWLLMVVVDWRSSVPASRDLLAHFSFGIPSKQNAILRCCECCKLSIVLTIDFRLFCVLLGYLQQFVVEEHEWRTFILLVLGG